MNADAAFHVSDLLGPTGGVVALAYAAGAASGWGFCVATVLRITNRQIRRLEDEVRDEKRARQDEKDDCDRKIEALAARVREVEDRYTHGMERQLSQVRQSSVALIRRDDE